MERPDLTGAARRATGILVAVLLATGGARAGDPARPGLQRIRGAVVALDHSTLTIAAGARPVSVTLSADYGVTALVASRPEDVAPGRFVGTVASRGAKGVLKAREIHVFPEKWRSGTGGVQPFDLGPDSVVATGTVEQGLVDGLGGTLTLTYPGGVSVVLVPPGTPVVTFAPGSRTLLQPGAHVVVEASGAAGGPLRADHVMVGADGLVPQF